MARMRHVVRRSKGPIKHQKHGSSVQVKAYSRGWPTTYTSGRKYHRKHA